jgi:single-strand DNA-binding protein
MLNKVILIGNVGQDPTVRYTPNGNKVVDFSIATNEKKETPTWHNATAFGKTADIIGDYVKKGMRVYVEGPLFYDKWEDANGNKRERTKIIVNIVKMLNSVTPKPETVKPDDDDIPF